MICYCAINRPKIEGLETAPMRWLTVLQFQQVLELAAYLPTSWRCCHVTHSSGSHTGASSKLFYMAAGSQENEGGKFQASWALDSRTYTSLWHVALVIARHQPAQILGKGKHSSTLDAKSRMCSGGGRDPWQPSLQAARTSGINSLRRLYRFPRGILALPGTCTSLRWSSSTVWRASEQGI